MDLLDPNNEPMTYKHTFLSSICTIRDLICWFQQCRYSACRVTTAPSHGSVNSRLSIPTDTNLHGLIDRFQLLKWQFVLPSTAKSAHMHGSEYLDRTLEYLGLFPRAHLLAIVSCATEAQKQLATKESKSTCSFPNENRNQSSSINDIQREPSGLDKCTVHIRMINYRHNPLYLQGNASFTRDYDPQTTTLQRVAVEFSCFCQLNITSFLLLQVDSRKTFSYPDDYLRSLAELGLLGHVTLYCHSMCSTTPLPQSGNTSNAELDPETLPTIDPQIDQSDRIMDQSLSNIFPHKDVESAVTDLYHLCCHEVYSSLKVPQSAVSRSVWKLPNNLQQTFIKQLLEEQSLTMTLLASFCSPGTCLTSLDLSYNAFATNETLKCVSKCASLQELVLDNEDHAFSNEGLWHLRSCVRLTRLSLNYCSKVNDWGIQVVGVLPLLSVLAIKYTAVTNVGLKHIYLHHLNTDADIYTYNETESGDVCASPPPLRSIDLSGLAISDESLSCIGIFSRLELLNLGSTHITNPALLPHLPELRHIDISHCNELVWDRQVHIKSLSENFPKLTSINVRGISNPNLVHVTMAISHCKYVRQVDGIFCHPQMTASLAASLSHLPLETVILTNCPHVTDLWLPVLARFSATLTHLVLSSCSAITGDNSSLVSNLGRMRNLSWLDLSHIENVNSAQIYQLVVGNYFPKLQVLWISLTEEEEEEFQCIAQNLHFKVNITKSLGSPIDMGM